MFHLWTVSASKLVGRCLQSVSSLLTCGPGVFTSILLGITFLLNKGEQSSQIQSLSPVPLGSLLKNYRFCSCLFVAASIVSDIAPSRMLWSFYNIQHEYTHEFKSLNFVACTVSFLPFHITPLALTSYTFIILTLLNDLRSEKKTSNCASVLSIVHL